MGQRCGTECFACARKICDGNHTPKPNDGPPMQSSAAMCLGGSFEFLEPVPTNPTLKRCNDSQAGRRLNKPRQTNGEGVPAEGANVAPPEIVRRQRPEQMSETRATNQKRTNGAQTSAEAGKALVQDAQVTSAAASDNRSIGYYGVGSSAAAADIGLRQEVTYQHREYSGAEHRAKKKESADGEKWSAQQFHNDFWESVQVARAGQEVARAQHRNFLAENKVRQDSAHIVRARQEEFKWLLSAQHGHGFPVWVPSNGPLFQPMRDSSGAAPWLMQSPAQSSTDVPWDSVIARPFQPMPRQPNLSPAYVHSPKQPPTKLRSEPATGKFVGQKQNRSAAYGERMQMPPQPPPDPRPKADIDKLFKKMHSLSPAYIDCQRISPRPTGGANCHPPGIQIPNLALPRSASKKQACSFVSPEDIDVWICLDFEWTCDEGEYRRVHCDEGEIIEFSFVVWDRRDNNNIFEAQRYCKPERTPITEFCTELTGISEKTLANAGSLGDALDFFADTLENLNVSGSRCCAVTHGPCDLELTLPRNCAAIGREVPSVLRKYVDLRELAQKYVRKMGISKRASSLREICDLTGIEMVGDEHCGLDDAWMVLLTLQVLLHTKDNVQVVNIDIEREIFLSPGCVDQALALDGVPLGASKEHIQLWLEGLIAPMPAGSRIVIVRGADGRPSGRAVVDFASHEAARAAFEKLACSVWSPGGRVYAFTDTWCGSSERLVLVRPLRRQEGVLNLSSAG